MKNGKKAFLFTIGSVMLIALFLLSPLNALPVYADEYDTYSGELDPFTGEPMIQSSGIGEVSTLSNRKMITEKMYFDFSRGEFAYPVDNGMAEIYSNAADGMILTDPVKISIPEGYSVLVYRDGVLLDTAMEYKARGGYSVIVILNGDQVEVFTFRIVGSRTGETTMYKMPPYFRVDSVMINGIEQSHTRSEVDMQQEGLYEISYRCERTDIRYSLRVTVDHTPPQIVFEGIDDDGKARGPVSWSGLEAGEVIHVFKDGGEFLYEGDRLTQSGRYEVIVTDDAGNTVDRQFTILIYLDRNGFVFVGIIALVIGGLVGYLIWHRRNMKVR